MRWSVDFAPMLPVPLFWAAGILAVILVALLFLKRSRGAAFAMSSRDISGSLSSGNRERRSFRFSSGIARLLVTDDQGYPPRPGEPAWLRHSEACSGIPAAATSPATGDQGLSVFVAQAPQLPLRSRSRMRTS